MAMLTNSALNVEDNPVNLQLTRFLLEAAGFTVYSAENAPAAIEQARKLSPSVILMDVELPGMDGLQATRVLKDDDLTASIPVVALTANAMHGDRERCLEAGCVGYITKPIDTTRFAEHVRGFIGAHAGS